MLSCLSSMRSQLSAQLGMLNIPWFPCGICLSWALSNWNLPVIPFLWVTSWYLRPETISLFTCRDTDLIMLLNIVLIANLSSQRLLFSLHKRKWAHPSHSGGNSSFVSVHSCVCPQASCLCFVHPAVHILLSILQPVYTHFFHLQVTINQAGQIKVPFFREWTSVFDAWFSAQAEAAFKNSSYVVLPADVPKGEQSLWSFYAYLLFPPHPSVTNPLRKLP